MVARRIEWAHVLAPIVAQLLRGPSFRHQHKISRSLYASAAASTDSCLEALFPVCSPLSALLAWHRVGMGSSWCLSPCVIELRDAPQPARCSNIHSHAARFAWPRQVQALAQLDRPNFQLQFVSIISRVQQMLRDSCAADSNTAPRAGGPAASSAGGPQDAPAAETAVVANFMSLEAYQLWDHMTQRNGSDLQVRVCACARGGNS